MSLTAGIRVGPYEISDLIGKGGMGEVFRALDTRLARPVAIKVLPPSFICDADRLLRFEQEARAAGNLNHPNIVVVYDVGTHEGSPYIIQEFLDGKTLAERLMSGPLPPAKVIQYGVGIASGLSAAHQKGIIHRDLKPSNLFLTRDGQVKILDFGLAKLTTPFAIEGDSVTTRTAVPSPVTDPGLILGTVGYMSPEHIRGQATDARSDIFALGAVLYEMVTGRRAFTGSTAPEVLSAILNNDPPDLSQSDRPVPAGLGAVIRHCLEKNPTERFQSAQDLGFQLASIGALSGSTSAGVSDRGRHRRMGAVILGLLCLGLGAAVGFLGGRWPEVAPAPPPTFRPLTFRHGWVEDARFGPDGQTVLLSATWENQAEPELFQGHTDRSGWLPLGFSGYNAIAMSARGELLLLGRPGRPGRIWQKALARAPIAGGAPRVLRSGLKEQVFSIDWAPDAESAAAITMRPRTGPDGWSGGPRRLEWPLGNVIAESDEASYLGLRVSHDGQRLAVFERRRDDTTLVLFGRKGERKPVSSGWNAKTLNGFAWAVDDRTLWVSGAWNNQPPGISAVTLDGGVRPVVRIPGDLNLLDVGPGGRALVSREDFRTEVKALPPGGSSEVSLSWSDSVQPKGLSADGRQLLYGDDSGAWLGPTDGSPPVYLGKHRPLALSSDGQLALLKSSSGELLVVPTAAGEERKVALSGLDLGPNATWLTSERVAVTVKAEPLFKVRVVDLQNGSAKELAQRLCLYPVASPDGQWITCEDEALPVDGGTPRSIAYGSDPGAEALAWDADGRHVYKLGVVPGRWPLGIDRVEVGTGKGTRWKALDRPDGAAGSWQILVVAQDGAAYVYSFTREESRLYLVEGLE